jgi:hypothetical protein
MVDKPEHYKKTHYLYAKFSLFSVLRPEKPNKVLQPMIVPCTAELMQISRPGFAIH